jgi:hypothetical protein
MGEGEGERSGKGKRVQENGEKPIEGNKIERSQIWCEISQIQLPDVLCGMDHDLLKITCGVESLRESL